MHTYMHAYIHTCNMQTYIHTYIHTYICSRLITLLTLTPGITWAPRCCAPVSKITSAGHLTSSSPFLLFLLSFDPLFPSRSYYPSLPSPSPLPNTPLLRNHCSYVPSPHAHTSVFLSFSQPLQLPTHHFIGSLLVL
jgi:hypothetical protein